MFDPIFIAPIKSGLSQYYKPFAIGNDAFVELDNAYSWRGVIKKREGSTILGRLPQWATATAITNASPPVVTAASHGLTTGDMVWLETVETTNGGISSIAVGATTVITTSGAHGMSTGQQVSFSGITGTIAPLLNGQYFYITATTSNTITIALNSTGFAYTSGGIVLLGNIEKQSFQVTVLTANTFSLQYLDGTTNVPQSGVATSANIYLPIEGTRRFITAAGQELLIVFHAKQAFFFDSTTFPATVTNISFNSLGNALLWTGTRDNFFYSSNYFNAMWTTNNVDPIRFYNGSPTTGWDNLQPLVSGLSTTMTKTLLILPYKGRLVALGPTLSDGNTYQNRATWSQIGTPYAGAAAPLNLSATGIAIGASPITITTTTNHNLTTGQIVSFTGVLGTVGPLVNSVNFTATVTGATTFTIPLTTTGKTYTASSGIVQLMSHAVTPAANDINAWRTDIPGKGGFIDADTTESIVSAEIVQDTLIVGFQFSTWRLRFTGNQILPFIWERINTQFGSEATFSAIPFDDMVLMLSRRGIVASTFNSVDRIDLQIPDQITEFNTSSNNIPFNRTQGIRDFEKRLVYWTFSDQSATNDIPNQTPNKILCFNYEDKTWSTFTQSFTCFGTFKQSQSNIWSTWTTIWAGDETTWGDSVDEKNIVMNVAGSQDSNVWHIMQDDVTTDNGNPYGFSILTSLINPYLMEAKRSKLAYFDIYATSSSTGQITIQYYQNDNQDDVVATKTVNTNDTPGTTYFRVFLGGVGRSHQLLLTMLPNQINDPNIGPALFELQGMVLHISRQGRIRQ